MSAHGREPKPFSAITHLEGGATPWAFTLGELPSTLQTQLKCHPLSHVTSLHACVTPSGCSLKARITTLQRCNKLADAHCPKRQAS